MTQDNIPATINRRVAHEFAHLMVSVLAVSVVDLHPRQRQALKVAFAHHTDLMWPEHADHLEMTSAEHDQLQDLVEKLKERLFSGAVEAYWGREDNTSVES